MGKNNTVVQEEKTSLKMCIFVPSTVMSSWEHVAAMSCSCLTDAIPQRIIGQARYYRLLVLLDKIINIIVRWLQVVPVCIDTYTVLIIACLVTSTLYANGTVTRQSIHVHQWCSCLDIYGTMVVSNNISSLQSLCVTDFVCQDVVIHWLMLFFIKLLYKAGCHIYVPEIILCT